MTNPFNPINPPKTGHLGVILAAAAIGAVLFCVTVVAVAVAVVRPADPPLEKPSVGITKISTTPTTEPPATTTTEAPTTTRRVTTTTADPGDQTKAALLVSMCSAVGTDAYGVDWCDRTIEESGFTKTIKSACDLLDIVDPGKTKSRDAITTQLATQLATMQATGDITKAKANDTAVLLGGVLSGRDELCV
jgi:hypothetical protein